MMRWKPGILLVLLACMATNVAHSDELTQIVQKDLIALGYDPGAADGQASTKTIIAVAKFQAEHGLEATGEITPQLAGIIQASMTAKGNPSSTAPSAVATQSAPVEDPATLEARRQACLQEKIEAAQRANSMRSGFGKLLSAVSRTSSRFGGGSVASEISTTTGDIYSVNASVSDLEGAAKDLGITESDVEACRNP
jgi:peptidoglycan hydrolase-like protein with peptidoglycan-binding domain